MVVSEGRTGAEHVLVSVGRSLPMFMRMVFILVTIIIVAIFVITFLCHNTQERQITIPM